MLRLVPAPSSSITSHASLAAQLGLPRRVCATPLLPSPHPSSQSTVAASTSSLRVLLRFTTESRRSIHACGAARGPIPHSSPRISLPFPNPPTFACKSKRWFINHLKSRTRCFDMEVIKRPGSPTSSALQLSKRPRSDGGTLIVREGPKRTSSLQSPIMLLTGHEGAVLSFKFDPTGQNCASASADKTVLLWRVAGANENYCVLRGHKQAVLQLNWTAGGDNIWTASADKSVGFWDAVTGQRVRKMADHSNIVNGVGANTRGAPMAVSGSDDGTVKVWDPRSRGAAVSMTNKFQVTAVAFSTDGNTVYSGGIDCDVKGWDVRMGEVCSTFKAHTNTITGLSINSAGTHLLSNGMDHCLRIWDIRPYTLENRLTATLSGAEHSFEQNLLRCNWSADGTLVGAGGADCMVHVWDALSGNLRYKLPGHAGAVTEVDFHPKEPIVGSCATDKSIYIGEFSDQ